MTDISVVIPNWNRVVLLELALHSLSRQTLPAAEVWVVDNGSSDGSLECAERLGAKLVRRTSNNGFAAAVNDGVRAANCPWVLVMNNDVELAPDCLEKLREQAGANNAGFAAPRLLSARDPSSLDGAYDLVSRGGCAWRAGHGWPDTPDWRESKPIALAPFTALLLKRELFQKVGGLDERFGSYLEDVDFGLRCAIQGFSGRYVPDAVVRHWGSATLGAWSAEMVRLIARNQVLLIAKHYPEHWLAHFGRPVIVSQMLWGLLALKHGRGWAWLRGKWEGLRLWAEFRSAERPPLAALEHLLEGCEEQIRQLQAIRPEWFWKTYFSLTR